MSESTNQITKPVDAVCPIDAESQRDSCLKLLQKIFFLSVVYALSGRLGMYLAIPPGNVTAVWPPSGIALAALLICGLRVWPGIFIGSFLVNIWFFSDAGTSLTTTHILTAASMGVGAALQGVVGVFLIRRFLGGDNPLSLPRDVLIFLALGGPLASLVNATVGSSSLVVAGFVESSQHLYTWWTWWFGDTAGVLAITPVALAFSGRSRRLWRGGIAAASGIAASLAIWQGLVAIENRAVRATFERDAEARIHAISNVLQQRLVIVDWLAGLYAAADRVDRLQFRAFTKPILDLHPYVQALEWAPRVDSSQRASHERRNQIIGRPSYQIIERGINGSIVRASDRPEYYPVNFVEPYKGNEPVLGFDLLSEPSRVEAVVRARDTGETVVTSRIKLLQENNDAFSFLALHPVYDHGARTDTMEYRRANIRGFVLGVYRISDLVEFALEPFESRGITLAIVDESANEGQRLLHRHMASATPRYSVDTDEPDVDKIAATGLSHSESLVVGGRLWTVVCVPAPWYVQANHTWTPVGALILCLIATALFTSYIVVITSHSSAVLLQVQERTAELGARKAELEAMHDSSPLGVFMTTSEGRFRYVNPMFETISGFPSGDAVGEGWHESIHPDDRERVVSEWKLAVNLYQPFESSHQLRRPDGSVVWVRAKAAPMKLGDLVTGYVGTVEDITDRKNAEQEIQEYSARLEKTNRELEVFASVASHDLQEPLRKVISFSTLLREDLGGELNKDADRDVNYIVDAAHRMRALVEDLLSLSRAGRSDMRNEPINLNSVVDQALESLVSRIEETDAKVTRDELPTIVGDPTLLTQLYQNLISNAMKFVRDRKPEIHLTCQRQGNEWLLGVRDNGIGIAPEKIDQIFVPFKRLHGREEFEGTGIGLSICRKAVERHDGRIWIESTPGEGSWFRFTLRDQVSKPATSSETVDQAA